MGFGISRRVRSFRNDILLKVKKFNLPLYRFLIFLGAYFKFINKIFKKKTYKRYSINLDEINKYEYKKTSQNNEDGIIEFIFSKLKINNFNTIEIGFDYFENNSINILKKIKKGLFVDGSEEKVFLLKKIFKFIHPKKKINVLNILINKKNINSIISENFEKNDEIDFLSIDVDGIDYYLFEELNFRPKIICIEYNFWYGKDLKCSVPYTENFTWKMGSLYSGASLLALNDLANSKDYYLIAIESSCVNAFFIRGDLKHNFEILDPKTSFKTPLKYSVENIEQAKQELLKKNLNFFNSSTN